MYRYRLIFSGFFFLLYLTAIAQIQQSNAKKKYTIPFELTSPNSIVIKSVLNQQDTVSLMLHTASSDVTLTEEASEKLKTIKFDGVVDGVKSWGGSNHTSDYSQNNSLAIRDMSWDSVMIWKDKNSAQQTDGKFGLNFFKDKVLEFDFDKNIITIATSLPRNLKKYSKFQLVIENHNMYIKAVCKTDKDTFANKFLIHTGYAGDILLDDNFVRTTDIGQQVKITGEKKLQDAYGNVLITKRGLLPFFKIGDLQLANVPVGFFEGAIGRQQISIVGGDILKRFNWIIDADRAFIYLKPNHHLKSDFADI